MAELGASWPVPSRGGTSGKKKHPPGSHEGASGTPIAAVTVAVASDLLEESASGGDPVPISAAAIFAPVDPPQKQQKETATAARAELLPSKANINPRSPRPPLRPGARPQHTRPPVQNGHRGRNQQQFLGNGGGHHQQRPRHQRNAAGFFPHQQPAQVINEYGYQSAMMGHANPTPEWGFNPGSNLQWGPGPQMSPPRMNTVAPPENVFLRGHFPRPYFDGFSYYAPPFPTVLRPTQGQNPPWFMAPLPSVAETTLQSIPAKPPLPPDGHQLPAEITQEAEDVGMRLRIISVTKI